MPRSVSTQRRQTRSRSTGPSSLNAAAAKDIGRIPPHLLPNRHDLTPRPEPAWKSPRRPREHTWASPAFREAWNPASEVPRPSSTTRPKPDLRSFSRSPSPTRPTLRGRNGAGSPTQKMVMKQGSVPCPYGWHSKATPETRVEIVDRFFRDPEQYRENSLLRLQLDAAHEQIRHLNKSTGVDSVGLLSPSRNIASPLAVSPPTETDLAAQSLTRATMNLEDRHLSEFIKGVTIDALEVHNLAAAEPAKPQEPAKLLQLRLEQSEETIKAQRTRIQELEARLKQREHHIDTLTRSLIDMGQHSAKLQSQVRGLVNEPPRWLGSEPPLPPAKNIDEVTAQQQRVKELEAEVAEHASKAFEAQRSSKTDGVGVGEILEALEEHRSRAAQIVQLNRSSMGLLRPYYLEKQQHEGGSSETPVPEEGLQSPAVTAMAPGTPQATSSPSQPPLHHESMVSKPSSAPPPSDTGDWDEKVKEALASGEWVMKKDPSTSRAYFYHRATRRAVWDLAKELSHPEEPQAPPSGLLLRAGSVVDSDAGEGTG